MFTKIMKKLNAAGETTVLILGTIIVGYITVLTVLYRFEDDTSVAYRDNILAGIAVPAAVVLFLLLIQKPLDRLYSKVRFLDKIFLFIVLCASCGFTYVFLKGARIMPSSDCYSIFEIAGWMADGDMRAVVPTGSYLSICPYQTGLIFIVEKMMRLFNTDSPFFFQCVNIVYIAVGIVSCYGIAKSFTDRIELILLSLLAAGTYFPMFYDASRIYGDVPSLALMAFAAWMYMLWEKSARKYSWIFGIAGGMSAVLACTYRRNTLIFVIAFTLAWIIYSLGGQNGKSVKYRAVQIIIICITVLLSAYSTKITQSYYEHYAQNTCGKGMPALSYIAMGLQDDSEMPGKNNGFHTDAFMGNGYDYDTAVALSRQSLEETFAAFRSSPVYMFDFFNRKTIAQWGNATGGCLWAIADRFEQPQADYALDLMYGRSKDYIVNIMNICQSTGYVLAFAGLLYLLYCRIRKKSRISLVYMIPLITFIGGFMFSLIWEAGPRYVMAYPFLLMPFAMANLPKAKGK
jgi:hypothetical protein